MRLARTFLALLLFGVSFGYVEAAVVIYLRAVLAPIRHTAFQTTEDHGVFPLLTTKQIKNAGPEYAHAMLTEAGREAATLVMLASAGLAVAGNFRTWLAGFMISFGVWDIFYYVFLRLLVNWPDSLMTWDILFLLPVPWVGPVIAPVIVALSMIGAGGAILWREEKGRPIEFRTANLALIFGGGLTVIFAFCWDWRHTSAGGWPQPFNWPLFALGEVIGIVGFLHAWGQGWKADKCYKLAGPSSSGSGSGAYSVAGTSTASGQESGRTSSSPEYTVGGG